MKKHEPNFERVRSALLCKEPDQVPLGELKIDQHVKDAFMGKPVRDLKTDVEFWANAGYDYIRFRPQYDFQYTAAQVRVGDYSIYGNHKDERKWAPEHQGLITTMEDFEKFSWPDAASVDYSNLEKVSEYLPDGMKVITGCTGIFESVWMLMGFETFSLATIEDPELLRLMFEKVGEIHLDIFKAASDFDCVGAMWYTDDIAYTEGLMVSPKVYREHLFPWMRKMAAVCREKDLPMLFHSDGNLWQVMDDILDIGINAIHPIEPKGMDIRELKQKVGHRLCLIGNIDLSYTLTRGTPSEVREEVKQRIKDIAPGGGYCVGSSNTVTNYVPLENFNAMIEAAFEFGRYPINL